MLDFMIIAYNNYFIKKMEHLIIPVYLKLTEF